VLEGDEYDTAYFDKGPKFLHYRPRTAIFTAPSSITRTSTATPPLRERVREVLRAPSAGRLRGCLQHLPQLEATRLGREVQGRELQRARRGGGRLACALGQPRPRRRHFEVDYQGKPEIRVDLPAAGRHNVENALGVYAACRSLGLKPDEIRPPASGPSAESSAARSCAAKSKAPRDTA